MSARALALTMAGWCLVLAFADFPAIWPYQLSRWVLCGGSAWLGTKFLEDWRQIVAIVVAFLFNPLVPIHFGKAWPVVDGIAAVALVATCKKDKTKDLPRGRFT